MKEITADWQEALGMVSNCRVIRAPQVIENGRTLLLLFEDPIGQQFVLRVIADATLGVNGTVVTLQTFHRIRALEPQEGDRYMDIKW